MPATSSPFRPPLRVLSFLVAALGAAHGSLRADVECARAAEHHDQTGLHAVVELGGVVVEQPIGENGNPNPLNILDCDADGTLELFITVSPEAEPRSPARPAAVTFPGACSDGDPTLVAFVFTQGGLSATWKAMAGDGSVVDTATSSVSGTKQSIVLASSSGIARVEVVGIRLCIESICWDCSRWKTGVEGCADPAEAFSGAGVTAAAHVGSVIVTAAAFETGASAPLTVMDCAGDDGLDLFIRWSLNPLAPVRFLFPDGCDRGVHPDVVSIRFLQGSVPATWNAYDPSGALVDTAATLPGSAMQSVTFNHAAGIGRVEVLGMSICVDEICWRCESKRPPRFRRGDTDADGELALNDAIRTLNYLFLGKIELVCEDAADADDSGELGIADAVRTLGFLFLGGPQPSGAGECRADETADELSCDSYRPCAP